MPYPVVLLPYEVFRRPGLERTAWRSSEQGVADICVGEPDLEAAFVHLEVWDEDEVGASVHTVDEFFSDLQAVWDRAAAQGRRPDADGAGGFSTAAPNRYVYEDLSRNLYETLERVSSENVERRTQMAVQAIVRATYLLLDSPWVPIGYRPTPTPEQREDVVRILGVTHEQRLEQREQRLREARQREATARRLARNRAWVRERRDADRASQEPTQQPRSPSLDPVPGPQVPSPQERESTELRLQRALEAGRDKIAERRRLGQIPPRRPLGASARRRDIDHIIDTVRQELGTSSTRGGDDAAPRVGLRQVSELRACGYQITGTTREERWRVFTQVAIPRLGRRQVVETIKFQLRLKGAQRNPPAYAIGEWQHDLGRLRQLP